MRLSILILGGGLLASAAFGSGWYFGHARRAVDERYIEPVTDKRLEDAANAVQILHCLDSGNTNAIRDSQQLVMVLSLLHADTLLPYSDSRTRALSIELLKDIAKSRAEGAPSFTGRLSNLDGQTLRRFEAILEHAKQEHKQ